MLFSNLLRRFDEGLLWSRITTYCDTALRRELHEQYARESEAPSRVEVTVEPGHYYRLRGGAKAYIIGKMGPSERSSDWLGYIVDTKHGIFHEFNTWWGSGENSLAGPMKAFDIVAAWEDTPRCKCCGTALPPL